MTDYLLLTAISLMLWNIALRFILAGIRMMWNLFPFQIIPLMSRSQPLFSALSRINRLIKRGIFLAGGFAAFFLLT